MALLELLQDMTKSNAAAHGFTSYSRRAYLLWETGDETAGKLCEMAREYSAEQYYSVVEVAENWRGTVADLRAQYFPNESRRTDSTYLLWVASRFPGLLKTPFEDASEISTIMPDCVIVCPRDVSVVDSDSFGGFRRIFLTDSSDEPKVVAMLLAIGAYLEHGPANLTELSTGAMYTVNGMIYSGKARNLALQLHARIESLLNGNGQEMEETFDRAFSVPMFSAKLRRTLPQPQDLPILEGGIALQNRMANKLSVADALTLFFGKVENVSTPEWLLNKVVKGLSLFLHKAYENDPYSGEVGLDRQYYSLPIRFCRVAPEQAERRLSETEMALRECRKHLQATLDKSCPRLGGTFSFGLGADALIEKLFADYLKAWERCIESALQVAWWRRILEYFKTKEDETYAKEQELYEQLKQLNLFLDIEDWDNWNLETVSSFHAENWRDVTPEEIFRELQCNVNDSKFRRDDLIHLLSSIRKEANRQVPVRGYGRTLLFWNKDDMDLLQRTLQSSDISCQREESCLILPSNTARLRVFPLRALKRGTLWELRLREVEWKRG